LTPEHIRSFYSLFSFSDATLAKDRNIFEGRP
jgi:hypothetical protein